MVTPIPRLPLGERLRRAGIAAWAIIGLLILTAAVLWLLRKISVIFPPLVLAVLIIYLLNPLVAWLERRRVPRGLGVVVAYALAIGIVVLLLSLLIPIVSRQVEDFRAALPSFKLEIIGFVEDAADTMEERFGVRPQTSPVECLLGADDAGLADPDTPSAERCDEVTRNLRETLGRQAGRITDIAGTAIEVLLIFILAPLLALYLLVDLPNLQRDLLHLVPPSHRDEVADVASKVGRAVGGFFRGQLFVALVVGVLSAIGFRLIGLKFWLVVGAIAGFFNLVPLVGPYIGAAVGFLVGVVTGDVGLGLKAVAVEAIVQQIDNHIVSPNVMKRAVNLHPVTVMLSILAGASLAGFWGVLLAVPGVAVVKLLLGHLWQTRVLGEDVSPQQEQREVPSPAADAADAAPRSTSPIGGSSST